MVLFFNGFCMDEADINITGVNYINGIVSEEVLDELYKKYKDEKLVIVGYSFGCYYANKFIAKFSDKSKLTTLAICGTPYVIDKKLGINPIIIKRMLNNLDNDTMLDFYTKIGFSKQIDLNKAKTELEAMISNEVCISNYFNIAILAAEDLIFPLKKLENQYNKVYVINTKHYIFKSQEFNDVFNKICGN